MSKHSNITLIRDHVSHLGHSVDERLVREIKSLKDVSQANLAEAVIRTYRDEIAFVDGFKWLFWTEGSGWAQGSESQLLFYVKCAINAIWSLANDSSSQSERDAWAKLYLKLSPASSQQGIKSLIAGYSMSYDIGIRSRASDWDADPYCVGTSDGVLDLRTGVVSQYSPELKYLRRAKGSVIDVNPEARIRLAEFLEEIMPDERVYEYVRWAMGRAMYGRSKDEALYIILGPGGTGKSSFLGAVQNSMDQYAPSIKDSVLLGTANNGGPNPELLQLFRARIVMLIETSQNSKFNEAALKQLTGGDRITCRDLHSSPVQWVPSHSVFIATNSMPDAIVDDALQRRIRVIPFETKIKDTEFSRERKEWLTTSQEAADAMLEWLTRAASDYADTRIFDTPKVIGDKTKATLAEADHFLRFADDCLFADPEGEASNGSILKAYTIWARNNHIEKPLQQRGVTNRLMGLGYHPYRSNKSRGFSGLRVETPDQSDESVEDVLTHR